MDEKSILENLSAADAVQSAAVVRFRKGEETLRGLLAAQLAFTACLCRYAEFKERQGTAAIHEAPGTPQ